MIGRKTDVFATLRRFRDGIGSQLADSYRPAKYLKLVDQNENKSDP